MTSKERIEHIKRYLKKTPDDLFMSYALATEYVALGMDDLALDIYVHLVSNNPNYFATYYHLGKLYERIGDDDKAEKCYEKGMEITRELGEKHAHGELRGAYEELIF